MVPGLRGNFGENESTRKKCLFHGLLLDTKYFN